MNVSKKVVHWRCLPVRFPFWQTNTLWLVLDRLHAPGWVWGGFGMLFLAVWIGCFVQRWNEVDTNIFEEKEK